ncbi:flagellin [Brevundimonas lenta]|uniref:Flagellar hook-associated protein 3 FlgL n=1 Tax=Brevundimonas lenta TaxID=424796 RepID=A0A7W6JEH2_9CAUL|nr:flagellin [Brevundimonas lenta]MBB4083663.1 flagellar hook-associated protein 3 FlgL [Brevundimonas lenta]
MTRVATFGNYQSALLDLMKAQTRGAEAQERVSTQKNATDLTGFGRQSETLTALKGAQSRIQGFIDTGEAVDARLTTQDIALNQIGDGIAALRAAVGNVLASDSAGSLMLELEGQFQTIRGGLNMRHQGGYLFSGAKINTAPVDVANLTELAAAPSVASIFNNDTLKAASRVAEGTTLETGFLANEVGTDVMTILRNIQAYHTGPSGPLTGKVNEAQKTFLTTQLGLLEQAATGVIDQTAKTGSLANQVESVAKGHKAQLTSLDELVSNRTDADMAKAVTDLELSQIAIQASAQVINQLRQVSLLNFLS